MFCHNLKEKNKFSPCLEETIDSNIYLSKIKKSCNDEYLRRRKKLILENEDVYKVRNDNFDYMFFLFTIFYFFIVIVIYEITKPFKISSFLNEIGSLGIEFKEKIIDSIGTYEFEIRSEKNKIYMIKLIIFTFLLWLLLKLYFYLSHKKIKNKYDKIFNKKCEKLIKFYCCTNLYNLNEYKIQVKAKKNEELGTENFNLKKKIKKLKE